MTPGPRPKPTKTPNHPKKTHNFSLAEASQIGKLANEGVGAASARDEFFARAPRDFSEPREPAHQDPDFHSRPIDERPDINRQREQEDIENEDLLRKVQEEVYGPPDPQHPGQANQTGQ